MTQQKQHHGLSIDALTFHFAHHATPLFSEVSLNFAPGFIHFVRGYNGAGKSTFLRILQGRIESDERVSGSIVLNGTTYQLSSHMSPSYKKVVKSVVQNVGSMLADSFSIQTNLQLANVHAYPGLQPLPEPQAVAVFSESISLDPEQIVATLSGGQKQLVAIMMMLQKKTRVLLLDEPTAALDSKNAHLVMQALEKIAKNSSLIIIIISHDKELVETYSAGNYVEIMLQDDGTRYIKRIMK